MITEIPNYAGFLNEFLADPVFRLTRRFASTCFNYKILADNLHTSVRSEVTAPIATTAKKVRWYR